MSENNLVYFVNSKMYINVTNLCTCKCLFCLRDISSEVEGVNMWIDKQSAKAEDIIDILKSKKDFIGDEITFCGYGEPLIELETVKTVAKFIKENFPDVKIRVNTNGHANLVHKKNVVPELKGLIDSFSVSLNAQNAKLYKKITRCCYDEEVGYNGMLDFVKELIKENIDTTMSVVSGYKKARINVEECEKIAHSLGAKFRVREYLENGYS